MPFGTGSSARIPGGAFWPAGCAGRNCPGFSGEQSAERTSRKLKGRDPCRRESTPRGNQPNSACAEFGCSKKIVPAAPATPRNTETHPAPKLPNRPASPKKRNAPVSSRRFLWKCLHDPVSWPLRVNGRCVIAIAHDIICPPVPGGRGRAAEFPSGISSPRSL